MAYRKPRILKYFIVLVAISLVSVFVIFHLSQLLAIRIAESLKQPSRLGQAARRSQSPFQLVVGHYVGHGNISAVSQDVINANNYAPHDGWGEQGRPVAMPAKDLFKMQQLFQINRFNLLASDGISLNRSLPDVRSEACRAKEYQQQLPTTSVIIVFYNEAWSTLMRTVWSVINRSPRELLLEILLVDDGSDREYLKAALDEDVRQLPVTTKVLRLGRREGLVAARLLGANVASGDVLTFLDSHCECSEGWLEPLLARVQENRRRIVCPVIDIISDDNFAYIKSAEFHWGAFNWQLHFRWYTMGETEIEKRRKDNTVPFKTPAMAGGLFAMERRNFIELGAYDRDMSIWGGENLELSFRAWQCGAEIEISPCSHVGHLFRKSSPYTFPGGISDILDRNLIRVAAVWMDDWGEFFFRYNPNAAHLHPSVDVSERRALRRQLNCRSFDWYLRNVWPENFFPADNRFFGRVQLLSPRSPRFGAYKDLLRKLGGKMYFGSLSPRGRWEAVINFMLQRRDEFHFVLADESRPAYCFRRPKADNALNQPFGEMVLGKCAPRDDRPEELFVISSEGRIMTDEGVCLEGVQPGESDSSTPRKVRINSCSVYRRQSWNYNLETLQISQANSTNCLEVTAAAANLLQHDYLDPSDLSEALHVLIKPCDTNARLQKWVLSPVAWK